MRGMRLLLTALALSIGLAAVPAHAPRQKPPLSVEASAPDTLAPTRPIRLFQRPEPIEAVAEVPDGPPAQFTWRRVRHTVMRIEGPERIAMEWWRDAAGHAPMRDYFRVESSAGVRVWLYREWPRDPELPTRWFMHGVFA